MRAHTIHPSILEVEAGASRTQGHIQLLNEFETRQVIGDFVYKTKKKINKYA